MGSAPKTDRNPDEIEITPEMIAAGVTFADAQLDGLASISTASLEALVKGLLRATLTGPALECLPAEAEDDGLVVRKSK